MSCLWPGVGIASMALQSGEGRAPAELCLPLWPGGQWRFMENWDLRCSFSSVSTSPFLLLRIKPGIGKSRWLDNGWLLVSLSTGCPSAKCLFLSDCPGKTTVLYEFSWSWRTQACSWSPSYDFLYKVLVFSGAASCQSSAADTQGHPPAPVHPWLTTTGGLSPH